MAYKNTGGTIRVLRLAKGKTQAALAEKAGIHRITLLQIELGRSKPDFDTLERLAKALGVPMARLV
jgi:transcriptional regulator with XRE-family HTH domain